MMAALVVTVLIGACTGGGVRPPQNPSPTAVPRGGTLRLGLPSDPAWALDPQQEYEPLAWELYRCCLLRTLLSYNGRSTDEGGTQLRPDLATSMPEISADGRTWIFHIKPGIHYGPPL
jgi:peptide/nickel transport system substrate-binding protein